MRVRLLITLFALFTTAFSAVAEDDPPIRASLSDSSTQVGGTVLLTVEISGGNPFRRPDISVDGLAVQFRGQSTNIQMNNFKMRQTTTLQYAITPLRAGEFTIPPIEVDADGTTHRTEPLVLSVGGSGSGSGTPPAADEPAPENTDYMFSSLIVPRESLYEGEAIPIETRLYFDSRIRFNLEGPPVVQDEGFVVNKLREPGRAEQVIDGVRYNVLSFRSSVTPAKSGQLALGPVKSQVIVEVPVQRGQQQRDPFDSFFGNSPFGNPFGNVQRQRAEITSEPVTLDVKPLPAEGRPASFAGAVGQFELDANTLVDTVSVGDPVTVSVTLQGRGDFSRVTAPELTVDSGWRSYPPTADFSPNDDLGLSGSKTFQIVLIPEENHSSIPPMEFSYFDPAAEEYVVLRSDALPLRVEGSARVAAPSAPAEQAGEPPEREPEQAVRDILHVMAEPVVTGNFEPVWQSRAFVTAQGVAAGVIAAWALGMLLVRRRRMLAPGPETARLRGEFRKEMDSLKSRSLSDTEFANHVARAFRSGAAVRSGDAAVEHADVEELAEAWSLDDKAKLHLLTVFDVHNMVCYAGDASSSANLPPEVRESMLEILKSHEN